MIFKNMSYFNTNSKTFVSLFLQLFLDRVPLRWEPPWPLLPRPSPSLVSEIGWLLAAQEMLVREMGSDPKVLSNLFISTLEFYKAEPTLKTFFFKHSMHKIKIMRENF